MTIGLATLAAPAMADIGQDGTVRFTSLTPYGGRNGGGEFNFTSIAGPYDFGDYITFCLELNETVAVGQNYTVDVNTVAVDGGAGGPSPDPLDARTAALYAAFVRGTLAHYDFDNSGDGGQSGDLDRKMTAAALQAAIWELEEERTIENTESDASVRALANYYVDTLAQQLVNQGLGGSVRVLNMWKANGGNAQDMLVMIPLPSAGALAGLGLAGIAVRRRRATR
ncbi:MAG: thioester domain-containing protein [Phycisphaerales bacterium]|nr:thioester domain-containing protein [Phycisphaerales bacterium]